MSIVSAIAGLRNVSNIEEAFGEKDVTTQKMRTAIRSWLDLYFAAESRGEDTCLRLPVTIVSKLYKTIFSEYTASADGEQKDFISESLKKIGNVKKRVMQYALICGECLIKPVIGANGIDFLPIRRDAYIPFGRGRNGEITSVGCMERIYSGGNYYVLFERRKATPDGLLIENKLYKSDRYDVIGRQIPLGTDGIYEGLHDQIVLKGVHGIGMAQLDMPMMNTVDGSADGVSVYAPAEQLIRNANRNSKELCDEFSNGKSRIIVSDDMMRRDKDGRYRLDDSVFVGVDDDPQNVGITIFNPDLRDASYHAREQGYLRAIENLIGLKRGILSEVEAAERTATEITSSSGDYNLTIIDIQTEWTEMIKRLLSTSVEIAQTYRLIGNGSFDPDSDVTIDYGDGVLFNRDKSWQELVGMVSSGLLKPELAIAWYFNEPHETESDIMSIRSRYMPILETITEGV